MSLPEIQQAISVINRSSHIALFVPEKPSIDAFSSMMAMSLALLQDNQKTIYSISPAHVPSELQFLPGSSQITMKPNIQPTLIIDIANVESVQNITQEHINGGMRIHIELPTGMNLTKDLAETHVRQLPYDCAILFGASDLADLGSLFTEFADFFYNIPIINIDHKASNEYFGTINVVDITASSIAEITHELITSLGAQHMTQDIATALYAGIVGATESFQKPSTTPHAFQLAADLMNRNAQTDIVIQHLVKTKPLSLLKISGRTYARLRHDEHGHLFWSILRSLDFHESEATEEQIPLIMHELTNNISGYNAAFILCENEAKEHTIYIALGKGLSKKRNEIQEQLSAKKQQGLLIVSLPPSSLEEAEISAIQKVRDILPQFHS
ncbi:MAG TPA: hypothetical protein VLG69_04380 [Candidatus Andersenbacteria bacterium]|nr:hypothetical protein [Candidatus Andersenbacteria bacterium]